MGLLRLILALAVVIGHAGAVYGYTPIDPGRAVQAFYVISGFYMALVLSTKYDTRTLGGYWVFLKNRYLRLAPTYWAVLVTSIAGMAVLGGDKAEALRMVRNLTPGSMAMVVGANVVLLGQDTFMFLGFDPGGGEHALRFAQYFTSTPFPAARFLVVPQAWTLGVELSFYVVAPLLARLRVRGLVVVLLASLAVRGALYLAGLRDDPWSYRFFPNELAFFVAGMLAYRASSLVNPRVAPVRWKLAAWGVVVVLSLVAESVGGARTACYGAFFVALVCGLPFVFDLTRKWSWDARLAELSYPVYVVHCMLLPVLPMNPLRGAIACVAAVAAGLVLVYVIERPVERIRARIAERASVQRATASEAAG